MRKSYLSQQIKLMTLSTTDLLTEEEFALYQRIIEILNELDRMETEAKRNHTKVKAEQKSNLLEEKHAVQAQLNNKIQEYENKPRTVRVSGVIDTRNVERITGNNTIPDGITWPFLRNSRKIAEFASDMSRTMGLSANDVTFDKIIVKWKSADMLKQIVMNGFYLPLLKEDGSVEHRKFQIVTASAGQLRRDKVQAISEPMWDKIKAHIQCGLDWDEINRRGGLNLSKLFAYTALSSSATDPWPEIDIDKVVVVKDFETEVSGLVDYIHPDYTIERGIHAVPIKHTDGCGMARPDVLDRNQMIRAPYIKGLVTPFDFVRFCLEHGVKPEIEDLWGVVHDLVAEDIQLVITASMFKLWKYYKDWDEYKTCFKKYGCSFCRTNCEENYIPDTTVNYQFLETLTDFTDEELKVFTQKTLNKINNIANNMTSMLQTLNADEFSDVPYKKALSLYPPLLRDGYSKESLKEIKKRWTLDAQSGRLHCENKRLFAIPDIYACCEFWFLHDENPKGLLKNGEVACRIYRMYDKVDCLRSPH